jgi:hypothetical protein
MDLSRTIHDPPVTTPDAVQFCCENADAKVHCAITRAALVFLAGHFLLDRDYQAIFDAYREQIADAALRKLQDGANPRYRVVVNAYDLASRARYLTLCAETPVPWR